MKKRSIYYTQQKFVLKILETENTMFTSFSGDAARVRRLLCFPKEDNDSAATATESTSISTTHMQLMLDMFVSYRVLDMLALVEGVPGLVSVERQMRSSDLRCVERTVSFNNLFPVVLDIFFEGVASHE